ncbi:DNA-directed RNA polymerase subunit beta' [Actinobacillus equuli]|nr:DNA-directed RNA polymerase subunit beta' [Actinobacillus equuli]
MKDLVKFLKAQSKSNDDFDVIKIGLASPDKSVLGLSVK